MQTENDAWPNGLPPTMPAQDRADIEELYARYAWGIDLADKEMALGVFAEDGEFEHLWQGRVQGHDQILKSFEELWYDRQSWWLGRQHLFNHFIMTPTPEGAQVRCFYQIVQFSTDYGTNFVFGIGTRQDRLVRREGRWLFRHLFVNAWRSAQEVPWEGKLLIKPRPTIAPSNLPSQQR